MKAFVIKIRSNNLSEEAAKRALQSATESPIAG